MSKEFKGKAIYCPSGKAGEYAYWACNFHVGCSNMCEYCYCKKGILATQMGMDKPQLKKCFRDEDHAIEIFESELLKNKKELQENGLFFSFTTDPFLPETHMLTSLAIEKCFINKVPVKVLTKRVEMVNMESEIYQYLNNRFMNFQGYDRRVAFGFTLTGYDELEPNASPNTERIKAMQKIYKAGYRVFASIEPIINLSASREMILFTLPFCNLYKVGVLSGKKYDKDKLRMFVADVCEMSEKYENKIYFKDSLLKMAGIDRKDLPANCVGRDFNIFKS